MENQIFEKHDSEIKMMGEFLAVELTADEANQVSGARWVDTWCATNCCGCADREFI